MNSWELVVIFLVLVVYLFCFHFNRLDFKINTNLNYHSGKWKSTYTKQVCALHITHCTSVSPFPHDKCFTDHVWLRNRRWNLPLLHRMLIVPRRTRRNGRLGCRGKYVSVNVHHQQPNLHLYIDYHPNKLLIKEEISLIVPRFWHM